MKNRDKNYANLISVEKYPGNKNIPGVFHKIINEIPRCTTFFELFAGSAAVSSKISVPDLNIILNDIDVNVCSRLKEKFSDHTVIKNHYLHALHTKLTMPASTVIFVDPPYLHETRSNNKDLYKYEMTYNDHVQLIRTLLQLKAKVMIIHPKCKTYECEFKSWRKIEIKIRYNRKTSVEYLYMNYDKPKELLTYDYIGTDCWDRQRIKRKGDRIINKLMSLPANERNYLIKRINTI